MKNIFTALFLFIAVLASAQEFTAPVRVNSDTTISDREPWMQVHNGSIYVSWIKVTTLGPGEAYFTRSDNGGASFLPAIKVTTGAKIPSDMQRGAPFTIDTKGVIHMVWVESRFKHPETNLSQPDVFYTRSTDNGMTWSTEVMISDDTSRYTQDFPSLAADSSGNVYLSFLDSREREWKSSENEQLYLRKSTDNGLTWSAARKVNHMPDGIGGTCECCKQDIQAGLNGVVTIAFRSSINVSGKPAEDRRDIFYIRSTDYGETFSEAVTLQTSPWILQACPMSGPNTFLDASGTIHAVWRDERQAAGASHIYYAEASNGNAASTNLQRDMTGENLANWPDIALHFGMRIIAYETNSTGIQYELVSSHQPPTILRSDLHFIGKRQQYGNVAFGPTGDRYIVWQEARSSTVDIYFTKDTMSLQTGTVRNESKSALRVTPNPVRSGETLNIGFDTGVSFNQYELLDIVGKVIVSGKLDVEGSSGSITVPSIANGSYLLRLVGNESYATQMIVISN